MNGGKRNGARLGLETLGERLTPASVTFSNGAYHVWGTEGNDTIVATPIPADARYDVSLNGAKVAKLGTGIPVVFHLGGGNDFFQNLTANRSVTVYGEAGDDILMTTTAAAVFDGGTGNDTLFGGSGNDQLYGGDGNDQVFGGTGSDALHAGGGTTNALRGGDGNDTLWGGTGNDELRDENGNDSVYGGRATTTCTATRGATTSTAAWTR